MNRFIKSLLRGSALALAGLLAVPLAQAANITVDGINYTTNASKKTAAVAKYTINKTTKDSMFYKGDIVIPETFTYNNATYTVTSVAVKAFENCREVTSVTLPNTCVTISRSAFSGCSSLTKSPIPSTVTTVGANVLKGTSIEELVIPPGWTENFSEAVADVPLKKLVIQAKIDKGKLTNTFWGQEGHRTGISTLEELEIDQNVNLDGVLSKDHPFHSLTALKKLTIGSEVTAISGTMFQGCTALTDVTFAPGCKLSSLGVSAFQGCSALTSIALPDSLTAIQGSAFQGCRALASVTLPDAMTSIGEYAFRNTALTTIALPSALTSIGTSAFQGTKLAIDLTLPAGVTSVGGQAFADTKLTSVAIPAATTTIGNAAFAPISTLKSITVDAASTAFKVDKGVLLNAAGTRLLVSAHQGITDSTYANATVASIDNYGLAYAPFKTVNFPALTTLGNAAFANSALEQFTIESNQTLGSNLFGGSALNTLVFADGRGEIPQGIAQNCTHLTSVTLPSTATTIMRNAFAGCTALENLELPVNVNYMEPGSVPVTLKNLRVLNTNTPVLAAGVFTADYASVNCHVAASRVNLFKRADQWNNLNIVADPTIEVTSVEMGCPSGLYFATKTGKLMYKDNNGQIIDTGFGTGEHALNLQSYKNRIYVGCVGHEFRYSNDANSGDGGLFYVNRSNGNWYRVTVLNNEGYNYNNDPFAISIIPKQNKLLVGARREGVFQMSADTVGVYNTASLPYFYYYGWLPYNNNDEMPFATLTFMVAQDTTGVYWYGGKYGGRGIFRYAEKDIYRDGKGASGKADPYKIILHNVGMTTGYLDEKNGYLYAFVQIPGNDNYKPGVYRIPLDTIKAFDAQDKEVTIEQAELIDDSPVVLEGSAPDEVLGITQITGDGNNVYWSYTAPTSDDKAIDGSVPLDTSNPLHHTGIKMIPGKGTPTVTFAVEGVEAYGLTMLNYEAPAVVKPTGISLNHETYTVETGGDQVQLIATLTPDDVTNPAVTWSSSDESVATVDATGMVTTKVQSKNTVTITATSVADPTLSASCVITITNPTARVAVTAVTLNHSTYTVAMGGDQVQLEATVTPDNATNKAVTWSSSDESVATVDENGLVTTKKQAKNSVTITATSVDNPQAMASCVITLTNPTAEIAPESITLNYSEYVIDMATEATVQLEATVNPDNTTDKRVVWSSSDETVASVDQNGLVTGHSFQVTTPNASTAAAEEDYQRTVTITAASAVNPDVKATCQVTVQLPYTGVNGIAADKTVVSVKYVNAAGQQSDKPFDGVNMVVTTYADGTRVVVKLLK